MHFPEFNIYSISSLCASFLSLTVAVIACFSGDRNPEKRAFAFLSFLVCVWTVFPFTTTIITNPTKQTLVARIIYILSASMVPTAFGLLVEKVLPYHLVSKNLSKTIKITKYISVVFMFLSFHPLFIIGVQNHHLFRAVEPGILYHFFVIYFSISFMYFLVNLWRGYKKSSGIKRNQLRYVFYAYLLGYFSGGVHFLPIYIGMEPIPHDVLVILFKITLAYAILKHRLMDISLAARKALIYGLFALTIAVPVTLTIWLLANYWKSLSAVMVIMIAFLPLIFKKMEQNIENVVDSLAPFKQYKNHNQRLQIIKEQIWNSTSVENACKNTAEGLHEFLAVESCAIIVLDKTKDLYSCRYGKGVSATDYYLCELNKYSAAFRYFKEKHQPMVRELIEQEAQLAQEPEFSIEHAAFIDTKKLSALEWLKCLDFEIAYPCFIRGELIAIIALRRKQSGNMHNDQDLIDVDIIAETLSSVLRMFERDLSQKQLTLSWVHDLIRPFGPKGLVMQYLQKFINDKDLNAEKHEMAEYIYSDLQFPARYLDQILSADKLDNSTYNIKNNSILELFNSIELRFKNKIPEGVEFKIEKPSKQLQASFDFLITERRVLDNFIENALRYVKQGDSIKIQSLKEKEFIKITVQNTGSFIPEKERSKIFEMGIQKRNKNGEQGIGGFGLANAQKAILEQGGQIGVDSAQQPIETATFWFTLPESKG